MDQFRAQPSCRLGQGELNETQRNPMMRRSYGARGHLTANEFSAPAGRCESTAACVGNERQARAECKRCGLTVRRFDDLPCEAPAAYRCLPEGFGSAILTAQNSKINLGSDRLACCIIVLGITGTPHLLPIQSGSCVSTSMNCANEPTRSRSIRAP